MTVLDFNKRVSRVESMEDAQLIATAKDLGFEPATLNTATGEPASSWGDVCLASLQLRLLDMDWTDTE